MALKEKSKHPVLKFLIIVGLILTVVGVSIFGYYRMKFEREIEESNNPQQIVDAFLQALMTNDLRFAKKLVLPEQKELIDQWKAETGHRAYGCPANWNLDDLFEPFAWGVGGSGTIDDNTVTVDSSYGCSNSDYSIRIERVIVKYDGMNWKITHWDKICESSAEENSPRACYPKD